MYLTSYAPQSRKVKSIFYLPLRRPAFRDDLSILKLTQGSGSFTAIGRCMNHRRLQRANSYIRARKERTENQLLLQGFLWYSATKRNHEQPCCGAVLSQPSLMHSDSARLRCRSFIPLFIRRRWKNSPTPQLTKFSLRQMRSDVSSAIWNHFEPARKGMSLFLFALVYIPL